MTVLFIDESKTPSFVLAATLIQDADIPKVRKILRGECRARQRSIHFKKEADHRKKQLLALYEKHAIQTILVSSKSKDQKLAREECFERVIRYALSANVTRLVVERDDSIFVFDEIMIAAKIQQLNAVGKVGFEHFYRNEEPLLWIADSLAWCENKGGEWRKLITQIAVRP